MGGHGLGAPLYPPLARVSSIYSVTSCEVLWNALNVVNTSNENTYYS